MCSYVLDLFLPCESRHWRMIKSSNGVENSINCISALSVSFIIFCELLSVFTLFCSFCLWLLANDTTNQRPSSVLDSGVVREMETRNFAWNGCPGAHAAWEVSQRITTPSHHFFTTI